jgi:hypothetical protein
LRIGEFWKRRSSHYALSGQNGTFFTKEWSMGVNTQLPMGETPAPIFNKRVVLQRGFLGYTEIRIFPDFFWSDPAWKSMKMVHIFSSLT